MATYPGDPPNSLTGDRKAQSHLNWLLDLINALEDSQYLISQLAGGIDGVWATGHPSGHDDQFLVEENSPKDMSVKVNPGVCVVSDIPYRLRSADLTTCDFVAVASGGANRHDLVQFDIDTQTLNVLQGVEGGGVPATEADNIALASVLITVAHSEIQNSDITDQRTWINV